MHWVLFFQKLQKFIGIGEISVKALASQNYPDWTQTLKCSGYPSPFSASQGVKTVFYYWILSVLPCIAVAAVSDLFSWSAGNPVAYFFPVVWVWIPRGTSLFWVSFQVGGEGWWCSQETVLWEIAFCPYRPWLLLQQQSVTEPFLLTLFVFLWESKCTLIILLITWCNFLVHCKLQ